MREDKRKRLIAKGWKVGTAREFLALSPEEASFIEMKLQLAQALRERRLRRRLTQAQLATMVRSSQSRVAKMEAAEPSVSADLLLRSLLAIGASSDDVARIISGSKARAASRRGTGRARARGRSGSAASR
jgi:predicted XRE-type DNA-binding protein